MSENPNPGRSVTDRVAELQQALREKYLVDINISGRRLHNGAGHVTVSRIVVPKEARRQGVGSTIMGEIHALADEHGWTVAGTASTAFGGTKAGLDRFYRRLGYVSNQGRRRNFEINDSLIRQPGAAGRHS